MEEMYYLAKSRDFLASDTYSTTCMSNARSLAVMGAYMANKGTLNGKQLISEQTWETMHSEQTL